MRSKRVLLTYSLCLTGLLAYLLFSTARVAGQNGPASLILHNGKIITVDDKSSIAQAVAIRGSQILAVGSDADVLKLAGPDTQVIDLKGRSATPGLIDTHRHMYGFAEANYGGEFTPRQLHRYAIDFRGVSSKDDVVTQIRNWVEKYNFPPGEWLYFQSLVGMIGGGTSLQAQILYNDITRYELDKATPNNPAILSLGIPDFNGITVNSKAIEIIWKDHADFLKKNGRFWIDKSGQPEGHLESPATRFALYYSYDRDPEILGALYQKDNDESDAQGLTTISTRLPRDSVAGYQWLAKQGKLRVRIAYGQIEDFGTLTDLKGKMKEAGKLVGAGDDGIWVTAVAPSSLDGSTTRACTNQKRTGTYTAIDDWYPFGQCYMDMEFSGAAGRASRITANYFKDWVLASGRDGVRFANTHVAGDRSVNLMLKTIEDVQKRYGVAATKGWALDHCDLVDPADFKLAAKLGVTMSCYVAVSVEGSANVARAYGDKVANTFPSPLRSMLDAGVKVVFESDRNSYLWDDFQKAITRKDRSGKVWAPQERIDRVTALKMATRWAADYVLKGEKLGSLEAGKLADLVVLDKDYMTVPEEEIGKLQPQLTILDGKIVFVHTDFSNEYNLKPDGAVISTYQDLLKRRKRSATGGSVGG